MSLLTINKLTDSVGAEVIGVDPDRLATDDLLGEAVLAALEDNGVLVFPKLGLNPEAQVAFGRRLGDVDHSSDGHHPVAGIYPITLDKSKNASADYLRATFDWHIDGCTPIEDTFPQMATVLSAVQVAQSGGETEFASSYAAYDALSDDEKERYGSLQVVHSLEASQRRVTPAFSLMRIRRCRLMSADCQPGARRMLRPELPKTPLGARGNAVTSYQESTVCFPSPLPVRFGRGVMLMPMLLFCTTVKGSPVRMV